MHQFMREPKYKLNRRDEARFRELTLRECLEGSAAPRKYPPLTVDEQRELNRLTRKRQQKANTHPRMRESLRCSRAAQRRLNRLWRRLENLIPELKNNVDH